MKSAVVTAIATSVAILAMSPASVRAQSSDLFFKGKTVTVYDSSPAGSGYDLYARLFARHIGRHLPGTPNVIVSNVPGAGGIVCANLVYNTAAKDGTALGLIRQTIAEEQALQTDGVRFDVVKFNWIGRIASNVEITYVWHTVPIKTIDDLKTRETVFSTTGGSMPLFAQLLNTMIGTRFKLVMGYKGTPEADLALERGEVEGGTSSVNIMETTHKDWMTNELITILVQYALERHPFLPQVPAVVELAKTSEDRSLLEFLASASAVGLSILAPPGVPADRLAELRAAFDATMIDPEFLADIQHLGADFSPLPAEQVKKIIASTINVSATVRARAQALR